LLGIQLTKPKKSNHFKVEPENWLTVMTFCNLNTQWKYGAMGGCMGLDYAGLKVVMDLNVPKKQHQTVFKGVQIMEREALKIINKKAE